MKFRIENVECRIGVGFTLAEVLITLGIIGIIAALTIPGLVANYKKKTLETRIKKFYSVIQQAKNMKIANDGAMDGSMLTNSKNPDVALEFFNVNYKPYLQTIEVFKREKGVAIAYPDGSGMYLQDTSGVQMAFCVDYKVCKTDLLPENATIDRVGSDGSRIFAFYWNAEVPGMDVSDRDTLVNYCAAAQTVNFGMPVWCTRLLQYDGWEIKDDYPIKF